MSQYWQQKRRRAYHGTLIFCRAQPPFAPIVLASAGSDQYKTP
ncbi:hypothetical protein C4J99_5615 [Pseudomonas synxantha]|nr:hypothetical protein C4J99_5615 [Pseudomonas synxantha]